jgi:hypothetical protein
VKRSIIISVGVILFVVALVVLAHMTDVGGILSKIHGGG